jgi:hypothetical protein
MNTGENNPLDLRRNVLLIELQRAEASLRASIHQSHLDALVRDHLVRALAHVCEATIAIEQRTKSRPVNELAEQLARIDEMRADLRARQPLPDHGSRTLHP